MASPDLPSPIDWALAERVAIRVSSRSPAPTTDLPTDADLAGVVAEAEELVAAETGLRPPTPAHISVIDRPEWIRANLASFRRLLEPTFEHWIDTFAKRRPDKPAPRPGGATARIAAIELGAMLGWVSGRVLGQYDLLVAGDTVDGQDAVYLVAPNMAMLEQKFGFDREQFRFWVALHELTHRAQFRGVPWMHDHYQGLVKEALAAANPDPGHLARSLRDAARDPAAAKARLDEGGALALVATPEQRELLGRIGGLMALLEGHGDQTMDRAASRERLPEAPRFALVLRERRKRATPVARLVQRLIGLEAKLNQYAAGARFLDAIETVEGRGAVELCWQAPQNLPTLDEVKDPGLWLQRVAW